MYFSGGRDVFQHCHYGGCHKAWPSAHLSIIGILADHSLGLLKGLGSSSSERGEWLNNTSRNIARVWVST